MGFQFVIDEGCYLTKECFITGFRNYYRKTLGVCTDHFNEYLIEIASTTITNEVDADLEHQFNLTDAF